MAASTGRIKSLSIVTTSAILPISKSCIKNCLTFQSTTTTLLEHLWEWKIISLILKPFNIILLCSSLFYILMHPRNAKLSNLGIIVQPSQTYQEERHSFRDSFIFHTVLLRCFGPGPHSLLWLYSKGNQTCISCWFCVLVFCAIQQHISKGIKGQSNSHMNPYDMMCSWKWIHGFRI